MDETQPITDGTTKKQRNLKPFKPGQSGNPAGRPKGKSIKELVRGYLDTHPEDLQAFVRHFVKDNRDLAWRMLEGNPPQKTHLEAEIKLPIPLSDVLPDNSLQENKELNETNPSN